MMLTSYITDLQLNSLYRCMGGIVMYGEHTNIWGAYGHMEHTGIWSCTDVWGHTYVWGVWICEIAPTWRCTDVWVHMVYGGI